MVALGAILVIIQSVTKVLIITRKKDLHSAYNIMHLKTRGIIPDSVFINMGKEFLLTEACILIALKSNYKIYVTVSNDQEAQIIEKKFPQINPEHIIRSDKFSYEIQVLRLTSKNGATIVINCLSGHQNLISSLNCVSKFGVYIEVNKNNCEDIIKLGLYPFLKSVSVYVIPNKISTILKLCKEDQKMLRNAIREGVDTGFVKPFPKNLPELQQKYIMIDKFGTKTVIKNLFKNNMKYEKNQRMKFDSSYSYIIVGNEKKDNSWFDVVEWLISKGARKLILAINKFSMAPKYSYQMNRLLHQSKISIVLTTIQKTNSISKATELIEKAEKIGPLEAVLFVGTELASKRIKNVDIALQSKNLFTHVLSIASGGLKECENRRSCGFPALVIHTETTKKISTILPHIDQIVSTFDINNSPLLFNIIAEVTYPEIEKEYKDLADHIPINMPILEDIGYKVTKKSEFREIGSLSLPHDDSLGVYPIFLIPSVHINLLKPLIRKLIYPVFGATLAESCKSCSQIASDLLLEINRIQPTGPVTLIGETWSASITLELSKLLEKSDRKCKLLMIDGHFNKWKDQFQKLGPVLSPQFEVNFIKIILNLPELSSELFINLGATFEDRLKKYFSKFLLTDLNAEFIKKAIIAIYYRLAAVAQYNVPDQLMNNLILFSPHLPEDQVLNLSVTSNIMILEEKEYENFLQDSRISQTINDNALFDWWNYTKC